MLETNAPRIEINTAAQRASYKAPYGTRGKHSSSKFRSTCDTCSHSKVRCDRERPTCRRCQNAGVVCNYSLSQRKGKPPRDANLRNRTLARKVTSAARITIGVITPEQSPCRSLPDDTIAIDRIALQSTVAPLGNCIMEQDYLSSIAWDDFDAFTPDGRGDPINYSSGSLVSTGGLLSFEHPLNFLNSWQQADEGTDFRPSGLPGTSRESEILDLDVRDSTPCSHGGRRGVTPSKIPIQHSTSQAGCEQRCLNKSSTLGSCCPSIASSTFNKLQLPFSACGSCDGTESSNCTGSDSLQSIDQVFTTTRHAISSIQMILECPCSSNSNLSLILALIVLKIISSYTAMGHRPSSGTVLASPSFASHGFSSSWDSDPGRSSEMVLDIPITMGTYQMDAEDENQVKLHLVLTQLRKVSKLVDTFAARYCGVVDTEGNGGSGLYRVLEMFLRAELGKGIKEVAAALKTSETV